MDNMVDFNYTGMVRNILMDAGLTAARLNCGIMTPEFVLQTMLECDELSEEFESMLEKDYDKIVSKIGEYNSDFAHKNTLSDEMKAIGVDGLNILTIRMSQMMCEIIANIEDAKEASGNAGLTAGIAVWFTAILSYPQTVAGYELKKVVSEEMIEALVDFEADYYDLNSDTIDNIHNVIQELINRGLDEKRLSKEQVLEILQRGQIAEQEEALKNELMELSGMLNGIANNPYLINDVQDMSGNDNGYGQESTSGKANINSKTWKQYMINVNEQVKNNKPLIGREREIEETINILCRESKNNPLHVGEPGVGKTKVLQGLASYINEGKVPSKLKNVQIWSMDITGMVAGAKYRGEFEERLKKVLNIAGERKDIIIYIDEIHNVIGAGNASGSMDAANILKPYLENGDIRFIGATTYKEYTKYFEQDSALSRRFNKVDIIEPSKEESVKILKGLRDYYEKFHNCKYTDEALETAVDLSSRYILDKFLPDKAIDLIDMAGAYLVSHDSSNRIVNDFLVKEVVSKRCNIPTESLSSDDTKKLKSMGDDLKGVIFGQDKAVDEVVNQIKVSRAGLTEENKPIASFLFVGPTGVGKTELAKRLATELGVSLQRFDMSEYMEKHSVAKFIGAPAGYVGHEDGGLLVDTIRKNPNCVLLLDEIEKAHPDIYNTFLQVMDYGKLTDSRGNKADFQNVVIIMTSNVGASEAEKKSVGFSLDSDTRKGNAAIDDEIKRTFSPEFRNRLSKIIKFNSINDDIAIRIVDSKLDKLNDLLNKKKVKIEFSNDCRDYIVRNGVGTQYGAREIVRIIDNEIKPLLVDEILFGSLKYGGKCKMGMVDGNFSICSIESGLEEVKA